MLYIAYIAKKREYPYGVKMARKAFFIFTFKALPALLTPVLLLGGIYTGVMTPTEAGAVAAFYAIIISFFVYRVLGIKSLGNIIIETATSTAVVGMIVGGAAVFSYIVTIEQVPEMLSSLLLSITENKFVFLIIVNILFLFLGMFIDTSVIMLVFIPMIIPLATILGVDLVHLGIVITLNMMIGLSTPPFGMLLFIVSGISKTPLKGIIKETLPMVYVMLAVLLLITFIPDIVMFLPNVFNN
jgi:C4-dicarboxylate transporter, DctM subunit